MIEIKEVIRYLGYGNRRPDGQVMALIRESVDEVEAAAEPKHVMRRFPVEISEDGVIKTAGLAFFSRNLAKNLRGCGEIVFFAATLGFSVDRLLNRYLKLKISKAAVVQAAAAAAIEEYCDLRQKELSETVGKEGLFVRPRFSPGYGDLPLTLQPDFLRVLDTQRTIGLILSEGGVMIPEKSVTAVMGLSREDSHCLLAGCEVCKKKDCVYRRN